MSDLRMPQVGEFMRGLGVLVEVQDVTPPPPEKVLDYIFEESTATFEVRSNGVVLTEGETYNEMYGKGTCVTHAIERAIEYAKALGESSLDVVVVKTTFRYRTRPNLKAHSQESFYNKGMQDFSGLERGSRWDLPDEVVEDVFTTKTGSQVSESPA